MSPRFTIGAFPLFALASCVSTAVNAPLGPYVNLVDSRGELPPFSARLPTDMTISRGFASARAARPGLVIDVQSLLESNVVSCRQLAGCIQRSMIIAGRPAASIRFRAGRSYPVRLIVSVPFRDKSIVAEAQCATEQQCDVAEQILRGGVFAQIALPT